MFINKVSYGKLIYVSYMIGMCVCVYIYDTASMYV